MSYNALTKVRVNYLYVTNQAAKRFENENQNTFDVLKEIK